MSRITEVDQILDSVSLLDVRAVWRESAHIMSQIQKQLPPGPQEWPFLSKEYASEAYVSVIMLNNSKSFEDMFRAMDNRLCYYLKESIRVAQDNVLRYGETLSSEDIVEWALRDKLGQPPLDNYRQVRSFVWVQAALRALYRCSEVIRESSIAPAGQDGEPAADRQQGRKVKLQPDVFEREIYPILDKEFPNGGGAGIKKRCTEIGKKYNVSESTIRQRFSAMRYKIQCNKSG